MRPVHAAMALVLVILVPWNDISFASENAPSFRLPIWGTEKYVGLEDFYGQIIVLDFFSSGCSRCFRASWEVETGINEFYKKQSGNPNGIAVNVLSVNSEVADPDDIKAFIEENELDLVLDDSDGDVLQRYGGSTVPFFVVIDATGAKTGADEPRVVYRQTGFKGPEKMYEVINAIGGGAETAETAPGAGGEKRIAENVSSLPALKDDNEDIYESALDMASLFASDIFVYDIMAEFHQEKSVMEFSLAVSYRRIEVDYESEYLNNSQEDHLTADRVGIQSSAVFNLNGNLKLSGELGAYNGYQTYRALWLDRYYRHIFDVLSGYIENFGGYKKAHPYGYNVSAGLRWEFLPNTGFADTSISFQHDVVSPGYEMGEPVVRLRDAYDTISGRLAFENILTRRIRTLVECQIDDTTDRNTRFTLQGALNYALAENWVARFSAAGSKEEPNLTSKSIITVLERDWHGIWFVNLFGRYYEDTSEIANAIASNAAAPPIKTYQAGLGVRRQGRRSSFKLVLGPCFNRYRRKNERDTSFDQLYKDRDWFSVQAAFLHRF